MARTIELWTWDRGSRPVDLDGPRGTVVPVLETVITGGLWKEFRKIPVDALARWLPLLDLPPNLRRLAELWIEEAPTREAASPLAAVRRSSSGMKVLPIKARHKAWDGCWPGSTTRRWPPSKTPASATGVAS